MILPDLSSALPGEILTWVELIFKPIVILDTGYWLIWHRRERRRMVREEEREQALEAIRSLAVCWPEGRIQILDDPGLAGLL